MNLFAFSGFLLGSTCLLVGVLLMRHGTTRVHLTFALQNLAISVWGFGCGLAGISTQHDQVLFWWAFAHVGAFFVVVFLLHHVLLINKMSQRFLLTLLYILAIALPILFFSGLIDIKLKYVFNSFFIPEGQGPLYPFYCISWILVAAYTTILLIRASVIAEKGEKKIMMLYSFAYIFGLWGGATYVFLALGVKIYPYGNFLIPVYCTIITYSILRHKLFDIEVIVKKTVIFAGLFTSVFIIVGIVTFVLQNLLGKFIQISNWVSLGINIAILILLYDPINSFLIKVTNKYLFQKKYDPLQLLKTFSDMVMASVLDQVAIIKIAVDLLMKALSLESFAILLINKEGDRYQIAGASGIEDKNISFSNNSHLVIYLNKTFSPINKRNYDKTISSNLEQDMSTIKAELCIPLVFHKNLVGFLAFGKRKSGKDYTNEDVDILVPLTRDIAIAVVYARLYEEVRQKDKLATLGTLVAGIKHEIGNPLSGILTSTQLIMKEMEVWDSLGLPQKEREEKFKNTLDEVLYESRKISRITKKFTDFARPGDEGMKEIVNIEDSINGALEILHNELTLKHIKIKKNIPKDTPSIFVDKDQIHQIFFNLLRNAAQAIEESDKPKEEARISIVVEKKGEDRITIDISDTGCGISEEKKTKIFEPFYTTKERGKGTGLGLAIARQLVGRNKGDISFKSQEGKGTTFMLEFPIAKNG